MALSSFYTFGTLGPRVHRSVWLIVIESDLELIKTKLNDILVPRSSMECHIGQEEMRELPYGLSGLAT
eukprot:5132622-Amphidinium_carterae.2